MSKPILTPQETRDALQDLVTSPGWEVVKEEALGLVATDRVVRDLLSAMASTTDMATLGALCSARLNAFLSVRALIEFPQIVLQQFAPEKKVV